MNSTDLREAIRRLGPWHHDLEIAPGVHTGELAPPGLHPPELGVPSLVRPREGMRLLVDDVFPGGLAGRSVLDCACNAGGYLFAALELGAERGFGFDAREHWIRQARFLAEHLPSGGLEFATRELAELPALRLEPFDVTLFSGILYHLPDPIAGLRLAADHTRELLVVNTAIRPTPGVADALVPTRESVTEVMSGMDGLAWFPTSPAVVSAILRWCGFPHTRLRYEGPAAPGRRRIEILAARDAGTLRHYDARHPPVPERGGWLGRLPRRIAARLRSR